jgi:hypothetical protein
MWTLFDILDKQDLNVCNITTSTSEEIEIVFSSGSSNSPSSDESSNFGESESSLSSDEPSVFDEPERILHSFSSSIAYVDDPLESEHGERIHLRKVPIRKVREHNVMASMHSVKIDIDILQQQKKERNAAILIQRMARGMISRPIDELVLENKDSDDTLDSEIDDSVVFDDDFSTCLDDDEDCQEEEEISNFMDLIDIQVGDMQDGSLHMDKISMHLRPMDFTSTTYKRKKNLDTRKKNQLPRLREDAAAEPTLHTSNHSNDKSDFDVASLLKTINQSNKTSSSFQLDSEKLTDHLRGKDLSDPSIRTAVLNWSSRLRCDKDIDLDLFFKDICDAIPRNTEDGQKPKPQKFQQQRHKTREAKTIEISEIEKDFLLERDFSSLTMGSFSVSDRSIEKSLQTTMMKPPSSSLASSNKKWKLWNSKKKQTGRSSGMKFGRILSLPQTFSITEGSSTTSSASFAPTAIKASKSKPKRFSDFFRKSTRTSSSTTTATSPMSHISEITERVEI